MVWSDRKQQEAHNIKVKWVSIVVYRPIYLPAIEALVCALGHFSHNPARPTCDYAEAGYDHVCWDDGPFQYSYEVFDDHELSYDAVRCYVDVAANQCCFYDGAWADEDVIANLERVV